MTPEPRAKLKVDIKSCARCGMNHPQMEFDSLRVPMTVELGGATIDFQFWATCPTYWEPVMLNVELSPTSEVKEELKFLKEVVDKAFPKGPAES